MEGEINKQAKEVTTKPDKEKHHPDCTGNLAVSGNMATLGDRVCLSNALIQTNPPCFYCHTVFSMSLMEEVFPSTRSSPSVRTCLGHLVTGVKHSSLLGPNSSEAIIASHYSKDL